VDLAAGASATATVAIDPRLLAMYEPASKRWKVAAGGYRLTLAADAGADPAASVVVRLQEASTT
jgi:beta-glucosidase